MVALAPPETRKPARCGDRLELLTLARAASRQTVVGASRIPGQWLSELERLHREYQRTGQKRFLLASIIHQRGIVARLEGAVRR
jgi:hypothetical protein